MTPTTEITKAILIYCPANHDQYYRPYESTINGNTIKNMLDATNNGETLTPYSLSSSASQVLAPSITPKDMLQIPGGMRQGRYAFFIEVTTTDITGNEREILSGFTNYDGINPNSKSIDPNMVFHLNSRIVVRDQATIGYGGHQFKPIMFMAQNVLTPIVNHPGAIAMRPEDVAAYGQNALLHIGDARVIDPRNSLSGVAKVADSRNAIPSHYLANICNGYILAQSEAVDHYGMSEANIHTKAITNTRCPSITLSNFFNAFGRPNPESSYMFTFGELNALWPRPREFWHTVTPKYGETLTSPLEHTEHWRGASIATGIAFSLTHILPALMARVMMVEVEIALTNTGIGGGHNIAVLKHTPMFDDVITPEHIKYLQNQIELDVIRGLLLNSVITFDIRLHINILTNSTFYISINGEPHIPYVAPMFCDSYYSPLIGLEKNNLGEIANSVEIMVAELSHQSQNPWADTKVPLPGRNLTTQPHAPTRVPLPRRG